MEVVRALLARGAAVDDAALNDGWMPLHGASTQGHLEVVRELLARGALPGAATLNGSTPLSFATARGHAAIAALLTGASP